MEDFYEILGVAEDAELKTIQTSYRRLAVKLHPDVNPEEDSHELMILVNQAYEVLRDPKRRAIYDGQRQVYRKQSFGKKSRTRRTDDKSIRIKYKGVLGSHSASIYSINFNADGTLVITAGFDNKIKIWEVASGSLHSEYHMKSGSLSLGDFDKNGEPIGAGYGETTIHLFHLDKEQGVKSNKLKAGFITCLGLSGKHGVFASGDNKGVAKLWRLNSGKCIGAFTPSNDSITSIAFSLDGTKAAFCDKVINIHNTKTGVLEKTLGGHRWAIVSSAFSADGKLIATGSVDRTIKIWDINNDYQLHGWMAHDEWVESVCFSPDGRYLASCSGDKTMKIWRVSDATLLFTGRENSERIYDVKFSPDGKQLFSAGMDRTLRCWTLDRVRKK